MLIGRIVGAFGVKGEVKVEPLTDFPERFSRLTSIYLGREHIERTVLGARGRRHVLLRLDGITSREDAALLRNTDVWIPRNLAMALPEGQFYADEIIGLTVVTESGQSLGPITDILETGANDVYIVDKDGEELLVPAIWDVVQRIDSIRREVVIRLLPGLS